MRTLIKTAFIFLFIVFNAAAGELPSRELADAEKMINRALDMNAELYSFGAIKKARELMNTAATNIEKNDFAACRQLAVEARSLAQKAIDDSIKMRRNVTASLRDNPPSALEFSENYKEKAIKEINDKKQQVTFILDEIYALKAKEISPDNFSNVMLLKNKSDALLDNGNFPKAKLYMDSAYVYSVMARNDCLLARQKIETRYEALKCGIDEEEANLPATENAKKKLEELGRVRLELAQAMSNLTYTKTVEAEKNLQNADSMLKSIKEGKEIVLPVVKKIRIVGRILNKYTLEPLPALVMIEKWSDGTEVIAAANDSKTGKFKLEAPGNEKYTINIKSEGYGIYSDELAADSIKDYFLTPVRPDEVMRLNNIFFEYNEANLRSESISVLKRLVVFMNDYPQIKIEIIGHTDNIGEDDPNMDLSLRRSKAVADFLVTNAVTQERLSTTGMGETCPIDENETENGRKNNRRVEIKYLGNQP